MNTSTCEPTAAREAVPDYRAGPAAASVSAGEPDTIRRTVDLPDAGMFGRLDVYAESWGCSDLPPVVNAADWIESEPPEASPVLDGVFDLSDKVCIIAASKMRKSFFALQLGLSLAAGLDFLGWSAAGSFRVLTVQPEIKAEHYHRRFRRMHAALGRPDIGDRLHVMNCRGVPSVSVEGIVPVAKRIGAEVVFFDPLYKFAEGDENAAADMKPTLAAFDVLARETGAAVVYVHHDGKNAQNRDTRDRGAGSGVLARDYDACLTLTAHRDCEDAAVVHTLLRNYPPQPRSTIQWRDDRFVERPDLLAVTGRPGRYDSAFHEFIAEKPKASLRDIAAALGCDPSTASRLRQKFGTGSVA